MSSPNSSTVSNQSTSPEAYEDHHVHSIYDQIASHFSHTRHKPWPIVTSFLLSLPPGSVGLDIGCGNGKYLSVNPNIFILGSDRSVKLAVIAQEKVKHVSGEVVVADTLALPHQQGIMARMDFVVCIAVVHHLSTVLRRREALRGLLSCLHREGRALIYVWALEQRQSRRGWDEGDEQDVMVPWVMKLAKENGTREAESQKTFQRYYHLYRKDELENDIQAVGGLVVESGYEKDNWWAICQKGNGSEI